MIEKPKIDPTLGSSIVTTILRNNSGMVRDFWWETDKAIAGESILCIRQCRFENDISESSVKLIRLNEAEARILGTSILEKLK